MTKPVWHKGPPPSLGWWPASRYRSIFAFRWWNGKFWSEVARPGWSAEAAQVKAKKKAADQEAIEWTDRPKSWPARSKT